MEYGEVLADGLQAGCDSGFGSNQQDYAVNVARMAAGARLGRFKTDNLQRQLTTLQAMLQTHLAA